MAGDNRRSSLDLTSAYFNARAALKSDDVQLAYPKGKIYNNLAEYGSHSFGGRGGRQSGGGRPRSYDYDGGGDRARYRSPSPRRYRSPTPPSRRYRSPSPSYRSYRSPSPRRRYRSPSPGPSHHSRRSPPRHDRDRDRSRREKPRERPKIREISKSKSSSRTENRQRNRSPGDEYSDVLERMEKAFKDGPLDVLYKCCQERTRVKVWTRNYKEVRGICTGYVTAFDKHWNMAMSDVDEVYMKTKKGKTPFLRELQPGEEELIPEIGTASEEPSKIKKEASAVGLEAGSESEGTDIELCDLSTVQTHSAPSTKEEAQVSSTQGHNGEEGTYAAKGEKKKKKKKKGPQMCKRHVNQLFIRGDNVVMVALLEV